MLQMITEAIKRNGGKRQLDHNHSNPSKFDYRANFLKRILKTNLLLAARKTVMTQDGFDSRSAQTSPEDRENP